MLRFVAGGLVLYMGVREAFLLENVPRSAGVLDHSIILTSCRDGHITVLCCWYSECQCTLRFHKCMSLQ